MRRFAYNLIVALLTFTVGVLVATVGRSLLPSVAHLIVPHGTDGIRHVACNNWENTGSVSQGLGWDLTYMLLLRKSGVCPGDRFCEMAAAKPQPPVNKHFAEWQREPIVSSILIELPDGHADMTALWLIRTREQAYWWVLHPHHPNRIGMQPLPAQAYDRAFEPMTCWQQRDPSIKRFFNEDGDGYIGFLSLYKEGKSRQMLLTSKDLFEDWPKDKMPDESAWGRLYKTLTPIYLAIREQEQAAQVSR